MSIDKSNVIEALKQSTPTKVRIALAATSAYSFMEFGRFCAFLDVLERKHDRKFLDIAIELCQSVVYERIKRDAEAYMAARDAG